jgi:hypothetical protein
MVVLLLAATAEHLVEEAELRTHGAQKGKYEKL